VPLDGPTQRKFDAMQATLDVRVLAAAAQRTAGTDPRFRLIRPVRPAVLDGPAFYARLPVRAARELRRFAPDVVVVQGVHELIAVLAARAASGRRPRIVLDVQGDWRDATRLYGSHLRRLLNPLSDRMGELAVRRADAIRTISGFTTGLIRDLGREPTATFPTYVDSHSFAGRRAPLPRQPGVLFVGVLQRYKNVDGLAAAWRLVAERVPGARLHVVGSGPLWRVVQQLQADLPDRVLWDRFLTSEEIARVLDKSTCLVLPSRSEGMGRVVIEAFARGRPVVGANVGGIRDLVDDGRNGLLVDPADTRALADALTRLLTDRELALALAAGARRSSRGWVQTPEVFAQRMGALVEHAAGVPRR
jgi:glycosyltransferase involved in cell wall biosynthesis